MCAYLNRYLLIFGGIHEITYELNDLRMFDLKMGKWHIVDEENKNAVESGSPAHKREGMDA